MSRNRQYLQFMAPVMVAICLTGTTGCQPRNVAEVPVLNKEASDAANAKQAADAKLAEEAKVKSDAAAKVAAAEAEKVKAAEEAAAAKAAEEAKAKAEAEEAAKVAAAEAAKVKAAEEVAAAKAAEEAKAKAKAEAEEAAKVAAAEAEKVKAAEEAAKLAAAHEAETKAGEAPACPDCVTDKSPDASPAAAPAPAADEAAMKAEREADEKALGDSTKVNVAGVLAAEFHDALLAARPSGSTANTIVQVNRVTNHSSAAVDRAAMTGQILRMLDGSSFITTTSQLYGNSQTGRTKAIHDTFDVEAKALGLVPTRKISEAPSVMLNSVVVQGANGPELVMSSVDALTGKTFWSGKRAL